MPVRTFISSIVAASIMSAGGSAPEIAVPKEIERAKPLYKKDTVTMCVMGDMMMHTAQIEKAHKDGEYDFSSYFPLLKDRITNADIAVANLESPLAGAPYTGYPSFSAPESVASYLASCGFDVLLCANNHILDKGNRGAKRTIEHLEKVNEIQFCGLAADKGSRGKALVIKRKGIRIALINLTYGTNHEPDKEWPKVNTLSDTANTIALLNAEADIRIALPHWGEEYRLNNSASQKSHAEWLARHGANAIIGSHPHVPQGFEILENGNVQVAYSLGNAVSNMSATNTQIELMTTARIAREENGDISLLPLQFTYLWCSRPGGFSDSYTVVPIKDYLDKKHLWKGSHDYEKMVTTYNRVRKTIKIDDN